MNEPLMKSQPRRVVFVNGPAGSGKDTATGFLIKNFGARHYKMASPLKKALSTFFSLPFEEERRLMEDQVAKNEPADLLYGDTPRKALISLSEEWAKPRYGANVFGRLAIRFLKGQTGSLFTVISDSGFRSECEPIVKWLGPASCFLIQLSREGHTFEGDSRSYVDLSDLRVPTVEIHNDFDLEIFEKQVCQRVNKWLEGLGVATTYSAI